MRVYLDHNATTPLHPDVLAAMLPYLPGRFGNPGSVHAWGREARQALRERGVLFHTDAIQSFGKIPLDGGTTSEDIDRVLAVLPSVVERVRRTGRRLSRRDV